MERKRLWVHGISGEARPAITKAPKTHRFDKVQYWLARTIAGRPMAHMCTFAQQAKMHIRSSNKLR